MSLIVQKYGGSSVATAEKIKNVARRAIAAKGKGNQVVVVISAMGDSTDDLIELAHQITSQPDEREMDVLLSTGEIVSSTLLSMAIKSLGQKAISLSGGQAGIQTDGIYSQARIRAISPQRVKSELEADSIVVVAGFQGVTEGMEVTTLGRGGSDTTAVALAVSLKADMCHIYTDVEGVFTADPRIVPEAQRIPEIDYEEMVELATYGAKVMHPRAVEIGQIYNMPILVACSFNDKPGTVIRGGIPMEIRNKARGIAHDLNVAKVTVLAVPDKPGIAATLFEPLAAANVSIDTIVQNSSVSGMTDLTFTVSRNDLSKAMKVVEPIAKSIGAKGCVSDAKLGKVSIVGTGMQNTPGYAARMFRALYEAGINIELITTSEIRITCIVNETRVADAVRSLHKAFRLDQE
ncbi:MAG TPA: aspartate kinase [Dehalococcoidia bacterium]|nr:aspartate kinase [Dehalococcoidia bacterium]